MLAVRREVAKLTEKWTTLRERAGAMATNITLAHKVGERGGVKGGKRGAKVGKGRRGGYYSSIQIHVSMIRTYAGTTYLLLMLRQGNE